VRRAHAMDVDVRPLLRPPAGRSGMVEVDMRQQHLADIAGLVTVSGQGVDHSRNRGSGSGFNQCRTIRADQQVNGRYLGHALEVGIESMDLHNPES
jgi:hypothetical protein